MVIGTAAQLLIRTDEEVRNYLRCSSPRSRLVVGRIPRDTVGSISNIRALSSRGTVSKGRGMLTIQRGRRCCRLRRQHARSCRLQRRRCARSDTTSRSDDVLVTSAALNVDGARGCAVKPRSRRRPRRCRDERHTRARRFCRLQCARQFALTKVATGEVLLPIEQLTPNQTSVPLRRLARTRQVALLPYLKELASMALLRPTLPTRRAAQFVVKATARVALLVTKMTSTRDIADQKDW